MKKKTPVKKQQPKSGRDFSEDKSIREEMGGKSFNKKKKKGKKKKKRKGKAVIDCFSVPRQLDGIPDLAALSVGDRRKALPLPPISHPSEQYFCFYI